MTQAFNLSQFANKVNTSGQADLTTAVTGTLPVANGGTNQTTYTNGQLLIGNTTGNTLTKSTLTAGAGITITNGAGSITIESASGQYQSQLFTTPGTWTKPASCTQVKVTVIGGGAGTTFNSVGNSGGTSSFGPAVSATGGVGGGANGTGTVSLGTALITTNLVPSNTPFPATGVNIIAGGFARNWASPSNYGGTPTFSVAPGAVVGVASGARPGGSGSNGGSGGIAIAYNVPVTAPVTVTVGAGGAGNPAPANPIPGNGGIVFVEFVG